MVGATAVARRMKRPPPPGQTHGDMMKITHLSNSFQIIAAGGTTLVCDPWVGMANEGGWHSYPEYEPSALHALVAKADAVYISHLHADHYDPAFLRASGLANKTFLIKRFDNGTLRRRLEALGGTVIELEGFAPHPCGALEITIVPQMTSNSDALEDEVGYDLDTSLIVHDGRFTFFNQVDNPLTLENFGEVRAFIDARYGALDVACFMTGAASGYPQSFTAIDRVAERERVIRQSLEKFSLILDVMRPTHYFPAGGTYIVPGRYHNLNTLVAQPDVARLFVTVNGRAVCHDLEGGWTLDMAAPSAAKARAIAALPRSKAEAVVVHAGDAYPHDAYDDSLDDDALAALFARAESAYLARMRREHIAISSQIAFVAYDRLTFEDDLTITSPARGRYAINNPDAGPAELTFHIDRKLLVKALKGEANWNQALGLALCERRPNVFHPTDDFSINYLLVPR